MDEFVQRLERAAKFSKENGDDAADLPDAAAVAKNCSSWGVTAHLKLHQAEGLAWLIRRYNRGVNVILDAKVDPTTESQTFSETRKVGLGKLYRGRGWLIFLFSRPLWHFFPVLHFRVLSGMGLGKTLQSVALLAYLKLHECSGPFLILSPLSVTDGWASELSRFAPQLTVLRYVGDKEEREGFRKVICDHVNNQPLPLRSDPALPFDILLTTYELAVLDVKFLSRFRWRYSIVDEAQRLKNPSTKNAVILTVHLSLLLTAGYGNVFYQTLQEHYMIPRRLLLTGTPVQNNLSELWSLLHFCMPLIFDDLTKFLEAFGSAAFATRDTVGGSSSVESDTNNSKDGFELLGRILGAFILRRTKAALLQTKALLLPPVNEVTVFAPLVPIQKKVYISVLRKDLPRIVGGDNGSTSKQSLQNTIVQLRKACSHPYLFDGVEPEPFEEGEHLVQGSGKLVILDMFLQRLYSRGHHVLIFAQMTRTLDIIQDYLHFRGYSYERLDGSVRAEERFAAVRSFSGRGKNGESKDGAFVFLLTTRAGGVGLNLVAADTVIFYEQDWNPQADRQALQRAHRIGQLRPVLAINLITENTIEEVIMERAMAKLELTQKVIGQVDDVDEHGPAGVGKSDLQSMVIFGLHKIVSEPAAPPQESDLMLDDNDVGAKRITSIVEKALDQRATLDPAHSENNYVTSPEVAQLTAPCLGAGHAGAKYLNQLLRKEGDKEKLDLEALKSIGKNAEGLKDADAETRNRRGRRQASEPLDEMEALARKKQKKEERKQSLWSSLEYTSFSVSEPDGIVNNNDQMEEDTEYIHQVVGDCTKPSLATGQTGIVFWCVDNSGTWGNGGVFSALALMSEKIPEAYESAYEASDLCLGDLHLIPVPGIEKTATEVSEETDQSGSHLSVALAVVQTFDRRRKVARSDISFPDLEVCIHKLAASAARLAASVHMPRIQAVSGWYMVERLLRKYATMYQVHFNVYYFKRNN